MFLTQWLRNPLQIGAIAPSSRSLARLITSQISPDSAPVIELGPGTGVFTDALLDRGVPPDRLILIEYCETFAKHLRRRFPRCLVIQDDAASALRECPFQAGAIVSGLPLRAMLEVDANQVVRAAFQRLRAGASLYQFTYGWSAPVSDKLVSQLGARVSNLGTAYANLPPARVYRLSK